MSELHQVLMTSILASLLAGTVFIIGLIASYTALHGDEEGKKVRRVVWRYFFPIAALGWLVLPWIAWACMQVPWRAVLPPGAVQDKQQPEPKPSTLQPLEKP